MAGLHLTPYGGHGGHFSTSVFKEGGPQGFMAVERSVSFPTLALALTVLFLIQSLAPLVAHPAAQEVLDEEQNVMPSSAHVPFSSGYGHDFAGSIISFDGLPQAEVREESGLNLWDESVLHQFENSTPGTPDLVLNGREKMNFCWTTLEGEVHYASRTYTGSWSDAVVDTVAPATEEALVDVLGREERPARLATAKHHDATGGRHRSHGRPRR